MNLQNIKETHLDQKLIFNMNIVICSSIDFTKKIYEVYKILSLKNHKVHIPKTTQRIINNEFTLEDFKKEKKNNGDLKFRKLNNGPIKKYFNIIKNSDAILVINENKNNIKNYIGANTFLEIAFAHILNKKIYLLNPIPNQNLSDELKEMDITILNGDLNKIN